MEVDIFELLHYRIEQAGLVELGNGIVEIEFFQHLAHIGAKAIDVGAQVVRPDWARR